MNLTKSKIDELRKIAEMATPGPWIVEPHEEHYGRILFKPYNQWGKHYEGSKDDLSILDPHRHNYQMFKWKNSQHIATFNPSQVIELLGALEFCKKALLEIAKQAEFQNDVRFIVKETLKEVFGE